MAPPKHISDIRWYDMTPFRTPFDLFLGKGWRGAPTFMTKFTPISPPGEDADTRHVLFDTCTCTWGLSTRILLRYAGCAKLNFLRQCFQKLSYYVHTDRDRQTDATEIINHTPSWVVNNNDGCIASNNDCKSFWGTSHAA